MLSEETRIRIAQLNRRQAAGQNERNGKPPAHRPEPPPGDGSSEGALPGSQQTQASGSHWLVRRTLQQVWREGPDLAQQCQTEMARTSRTQPLPGDDEVRAFRESFPHQTVFLDLETCGFAGSMIFLAGMLHPTATGLVMSQLLARNYAEEKPMLQSLWQLVTGCRVLVTFNGKSFDWPQVVDRSTLHQLLPGPLGEQSATGAARLHFDLLHHARRRWRDQLPNCKLQTLERHVCGRYRTGDIPGRDIPSAYHHFVRTGQVTALRSILHHNALDLVTLLQLAMRVATGDKSRKAADLRHRDAGGSLR